MQVQFQQLAQAARQRDAEAAMQKPVEVRIRPDDSHREAYIGELVHPDEGGMGEMELFDCLHRMDIENLQDFYLDCKNLFTDSVSNQDRSKIVRFFMKSGEWPALSRQVRFIMPQEAKGHDVAWAVEVLTGIDPAIREKVVTVANRFFSPTTETVERGYILASLCKAENLTRLDELDRYDAGQRDEFIRRSIPSGIASGKRPVYRFDRVLEKGWQISYVMENLVKV